MADFTFQAVHYRTQDLVGKVAVVTGGSKGIGRSIVYNLATRGCNVLATFSSPESSKLFDTVAQSVADAYADLNSRSGTAIAENMSSGPKVFGIQADITSLDCATTIVNKLEEHFDGKLDILINNAAITGGTKIGQTSCGEVQQKLLANVQTPIMLVDEMVRRKMFRPGSRIINISSDRARSTSSVSVIYSATKAALESVARTWATALGGNDEAYAFMAGTTANSISVGPTESDAVTRMSPTHLEQRMKIELAKQVIAPQGQPYFAQCDDVADVVGMLCSKEARWITGSVIPANGGAAMIL